MAVLPQELSEIELEESRKNCIREGFVFSLCSGIFANFFTPFAILLNAGNFAIGLLNSLPELISALVQPFAAFLADWLNSRKNAVMVFAFLQSVSFILIAFVPFLSSFLHVDPIILLIFLVCVAALFNASVSPAWSSWVNDLIPESIRSPFFARRRKLAEIGLLLSLFFAGLLLSFLTAAFSAVLGFAVLFLLAFCFRFISLFFFSKMKEPVFEPDKKNFFPDKKMLKNDFGLFAIYVSLTYFSVYLTAGFFALYYLEFLNFSYFEYGIVVAAASVASILFYTYWGQITNLFGYKKAMIASAISISFIPLFVMFSSSFWWILIVELLTGFAWAGFNLISFNFMLQLMPDRKNSEKFVGFFNLVSGLGAFAGALLGGLLAANFEKIVLPFGWPYLFALFILSFVLRLFFSLFLLPRVIENEKFSPVSLEVLSITTIRPWRGLVFELMHDFNFVKTIPSRTKLEIMGFAARASDRLERARGHILDIHKNHLTPQKLSEKLNSAQKEMVKVSGLIFKMGKKSEELRKEKKAVEKDKAV